MWNGNLDGFCSRKGMFCHFAGAFGGCTMNTCVFGQYKDVHYSNKTEPIRRETVYEGEKDMVEIKRTVKKEVEENVKMKLVPVWYAAICDVSGKDFAVFNIRKRIEFDHEPLEKELEEELAKEYFNYKNLHVSVTKNYKLVEQD